MDASRHETSTRLPPASDDRVPRFRGHLAQAGICDRDELDRIDRDAAAAVEAALHAVMSADSPSLDELDRDVYATPIRFPV